MSISKSDRSSENLRPFQNNSYLTFKKAAFDCCCNAVMVSLKKTDLQVLEGGKLKQFFCKEVLEFFIFE